MLLPGPVCTHKQLGIFTVTAVSCVTYRVCCVFVAHLKAKLACHPARCLLPVEIIERCGLATSPATVELLPYLLPY